MAKKELGNYVRETRVRDGISLRQLARDLGISHVQLGRIERGQHQLAERHWPAFLRAVPSATKEGLQLAVGAGAHLSSALEQASSSYRQLGHVLARRIEQGKDLDPQQLEEVLRILGGDGGEPDQSR